MVQARWHAAKNRARFRERRLCRQAQKNQSHAKNLNAQLTAQRDRLDQMLRSDQRISREHAEQYYWQHGLMSYLTRPLIWQFFQNENDENSIAALWLNGQWVDEHARR